MLSLSTRMSLIIFCGTFLTGVSTTTVVAQNGAYRADSSAANVRTWSWHSMGSLKDARELPRLVEWGDGQVLIVGGGSELRAVALKTTEVFDAKTQKWSMGPELTYPRRDAEVVKLSDGRVFAIGGSTGPTRTGSTHVEALEPQAKRWTRVASLTVPRIGHTATLLQDGRILVVGGQMRPGQYTASAEIYNPKSNTWSPAGRMNEVRSLHHARMLKDGKVLVIGGGTDISATSTVELFDPGSKSWSYVGSMKEPRWGFASAVLDDGRVLVAGGRVPAKKGATLPDDQMVILQGAEIYNPQTKQWTPTAPMNTPRSMGLPNVDLRKLPNGGFLFVGGRTYPAPYHGTNSVEYFDPRDNTWNNLAPMQLGRSYHASILLANGEILIVGGRGPKFLPINEVECFEPRR